jgi:5-methylcytosine-specific restriction endonuclease McrA
MPTAPPKACLSIRCAGLGRDGNAYCLGCQKTRALAHGPKGVTGSPYDHRWRMQIRAPQLRRRPFCEMCNRRGRRVIATAVDHIKRHTGRDDPLFSDTRNLQSLCSSCHGFKTMYEQHHAGWGTTR